MSLENGEARIEFDDGKTSAEQLAAAIDRLGFRAKVLAVTDGGKGGS
ncbi:MAG: hypothetical protein L0214_09820 [candidate division NC10 bacterium]|nr:hypothetical protein [candidate division NC10 bacterium]